MSLATENVKCALCGGSVFTTVYPEVNRIDTPGTQVVKCNRCDLVYLNPRLKNFSDNFTLTETYLHRDYLPYYKNVGLLDAAGDISPSQNYAYHQGYLEKMRSYRRKNRVLDIGCAIGLFVAATRMEGWDGAGLDPSGPLSGYGRTRLQLPVVQAELRDLKFPANHFDVISLFDVTEHLLDPVAVYREVYRILRPGGLLLFQMPNWGSIACERLGPSWNMFVTDHFYYFTPATLARLLRRVGFEHMHVEAKLLVEAEIEELTDEIGREAVEDAQTKLSMQGTANRGSTITGYAEKSMTTQDRVRRALEMIRDYEWKALVHECKRYVRWKLTNVRQR